MRITLFRLKLIKRYLFLLRYFCASDPKTPIAETAQALADTVHQGKALYVGISNYCGENARQMIQCMRETGVPCLINQLPFNMLDRKASESGEFDDLRNDGVGAITFSPLAQGLLSDRYLKGIPHNSRAATAGSCLEREQITKALQRRIRLLNDIALARGQTLAQMALCWNLSFEPVTSVLIGASRTSQIIENVEALKQPSFAEEELEQIHDAIIGESA